MRLDRVFKTILLSIVTGSLFFSPGLFAQGSAGDPGGLPGSDCP